MKNSIFILFWLLISLTACQSSRVALNTKNTTCVQRETASCPGYYEEDINNRTSWGFHDIRPIKQNPEILKYYREPLQLDSVGAVFTETRPFRASAFYLGSIVEQNGEKRHYFGISAHVADRRPYSVEFGQLNDVNGLFRVELNSKPIYYSIASDISILSASHVPPHIETRLNELKPYSLLCSGSNSSSGSGRSIKKICWL